jgi:hypothetical protein
LEWALTAYNVTSFIKRSPLLSHSFLSNICCNVYA